MKQIWISAAVFLLALAVGLMSVFCVRAAGEETNARLARSAEAARQERYTDAQDALLEAKDAWEGREQLLGVFLHHEEVDEVVALFAQLEQFARLQDQDDYLAACHELMARIEHVRRMELPTVENIL